MTDFMTWGDVWKMLVLGGGIVILLWVLVYACVRYVAWELDHEAKK